MDSRREEQLLQAVWARVQQGLNRVGQASVRSLETQGPMDNTCFLHAVNNAIGEIVTLSREIDDKHPQVHVNPAGVPQQNSQAFLEAREPHLLRTSIEMRDRGFPTQLEHDFLRQLRVQAEEVAELHTPFNATILAGICDALFEEPQNVAAILCLSRQDTPIGHCIALRVNRANPHAPIIHVQDSAIDGRPLTQFADVFISPHRTESDVMRVIRRLQLGQEHTDRIFLIRKVQGPVPDLPPLRREVEREMASLAPPAPPAEPPALAPSFPPPMGPVIRPEPIRPSFPPPLQPEPYRPPRQEQFGPGPRPR